MKSLTHYILLIGAIVLVLIVVLGAVTFYNIAALQRDTRHLAADIIVEHQVVEEFVQSVQLMVIHAHSYDLTGDSEHIQKARDELQIARILLPTLREVTARVEEDSQTAVRQAQREELVESTDDILTQIEEGVAEQDRQQIREALRELEQVSQEVLVLNATTQRLLDNQSEDAIQSTQRSTVRVYASTVTLLVLFTLIIFITLLIVRYRFVGDLNELLQVVNTAGRGNLDLSVQVTSNHEIGQLQRGINQMIDSLREQRTRVDERNSALEASNQQQRQMIETINALSTPILPVRDDVLILPIVGHVDDQRATLITASLLEAVHAQRAKTAILDITGMATLDTSVLHLLLNTVRATELLGAQAYIAGISAEFAQVMVEQQDNLDQLQSFATLRDALEVILAE